MELWIIGGIALIFIVMFFWWSSERERLRLQRLAQRRLDLVLKYVDQAVVDNIMNEKVWKGATAEQIVESWGKPADIDRTVFKSKTKETWKYHQVGKNRYRQRVFLENDRVVGWSDN